MAKQENSCNACMSDKKESCLDACKNDKKESCLDACKNEFREFSAIAGDSPVVFETFKNYHSRLHGTDPRLITRQPSAEVGMGLLQELEELGEKTVFGERQKEIGGSEEEVLFDLAMMSDEELKNEKKKLQKEYQREVNRAWTGWKIGVNYGIHRKKYIKQWLKKFTDDDWYHQANDHLRKLKLAPTYVEQLSKEKTARTIYDAERGKSGCLEDRRHIEFQMQGGVFEQFVMSARRDLDDAKERWDAFKRQSPLGFKATDVYNFKEYWELIKGLDEKYESIDKILYMPDCDSMILDNANKQTSKDAKFIYQEMKVESDLNNMMFKKMKTEWGLTDDEPVEKVFKKLQMTVAEMGLRLKGKGMGKT